MIPTPDNKHPYLVVTLVVAAAVLVPLLIAFAYEVGFVSGKAALLLGGLVAAGYGAIFMWLVLSRRLTFYSGVAKKE